MIERFATGIAGFDEISGGGLPLRRSTLIAGEAGAGKTLFLLSVIAAGPLARGEAALFLSMEERPETLVANARSIGLDLAVAVDEGRLRIDHIGEPAEHSVERGPYSLEGLRIRIAAGLKAANARFLAIDTIEALFARFENGRILRAELVRLFRWLQSEGITTLISGEKGAGPITRRGLEEYVSDCVIVLENDTEGEVATRRLRILKYRGAAHGLNKYPFLIAASGITIMPISSARFDHRVSAERVGTGIGALDTALDGGLRRGSTSLLSGGTGSGKTIFASHAVEAACERGERALYLSFEESPDELVQNVSAAGVALAPHREAGRLVVISARPTLMGLEQHLVILYRQVIEHAPRWWWSTLCRPSHRRETRRASTARPCA